MSFQDYTEIKAVNISSLSNLEPSTGGSPALYRYRMDHPRPDTAAMAAGRALHTAVLEPEAFDGRYTILQGNVPDYWREVYDLSNAGKLLDKYAVFDGALVRNGNAWKAFALAHGDDPRPILLEKEVDRCLEIGAQVGDREILTPAQKVQALALAAAVHQHRRAMEFIRGARYEETITAVDPVTGLAIKGRLDIIKPMAIGDLKKTAKPIGTAVKFGFRRQATDLLYHAKLAWYHWLAEIAGAISADAQPPVLIVVEDREAGGFVDVDVVPLSRAALESGTRVFRRWLDMLNACMVADHWPGAGGGEEWEPEHWAAGMESDQDEVDEGVGF